MYDSIEFAVTDCTTLRGRLYGETNEKVPKPLIILTGGISATIDFANHPAFAEAFAKAGFLVLMYDHRNFGLSDGDIRQEVLPQQQVEDMRDAITFAQMQPGVDGERIGVWGSSFSGGHAINIAAIDHRVKCLSVQVPFVSGSQTVARQVRPDMLAMVRKMWAADRIGRMAGQPPMMMPVTTENPTEPAVMPQEEAWIYTAAHRAESELWQNEVTVRSMELASSYEPAALIHLISPRPLQMIIGSLDCVTTPDIAQAAFDRAGQPKKLVVLESGHFGLYHDKFEAAAKLAIDWFSAQL